MADSDTGIAVAVPSAEEMVALRQGAAWAARPGDRLDLLGDDRVRFLHNLVTCEVRELAAGRATRGFVTHVKGGVLADVEIVVLADRLRLELPAGRGPAIRAHLERYRIADRVEILSRADLVAFTLRGRRAPDLLASLALPRLEPGEWRDGEIDGVFFAVRREGRGREPRYELVAAAGDGDRFDAAVARAGAEHGLRAVSPAALELARIEDGELAWGVDYGEENFPQETGEEAAVSYTKGCYLGQEVVARIHYRGGVQRLARRLRFDAGGELSPGVELSLDGRPVARATSLAREPASGELRGLALVHRRAADEGTRLTTPEGRVATVEPPQPD